MRFRLKIFFTFIIFFINSMAFSGADKKHTIWSLFSNNSKTNKIMLSKEEKVHFAKEIAEFNYRNDFESVRIKSIERIIIHCIKYKLGCFSCCSAGFIEYMREKFRTNYTFTIEERKNTLQKSLLMLFTDDEINFLHRLTLDTKFSELSKKFQTSMIFSLDKIYEPFIEGEIPYFEGKFSSEERRLIDLLPLVNEENEFDSMVNDVKSSLGVELDPRLYRRYVDYQIIFELRKYFNTEDLIYLNNQLDHEIVKKFTLADAKCSKLHPISLYGIDS